MITKITNGKIIGKDSISMAESDLYFESTSDGKGKIIGIFPKNSPIAPTPDEVIDADGLFVSPGFIDLHTHGAGGSDFLDCEKDGFLKAAYTHATHGTTALLPTATSGDLAELFETIDVYRKAKRENEAGVLGSAFLGLHLEGPYFALSQKGAQDEAYVRGFDKDEYTRILAYGGSDIRRWSAAPELEGAQDFAHTLVSHGVLPSIGHTDASEDDVYKAFDAGFTHVTHLYSCTSGVHRKNGLRYAGVIECAYLIDGITVEIIADGVHLPASLLKLIYKIKGADRTALVTDSMRAAGMPEGESILGSKTHGLRVIVEDGVAKMPDRTCFAGSVATMDRLVRNMVYLAGVSLTDAVKMASETPARIIGEVRKGSLLPGYDADILLFDQDIHIHTVIIGGKAVFYDKKGTQQAT